MIRVLLSILIACLVPFGSAGAQQSDPQSDFEAFWTLFDEQYALFEVKGVDWDVVGDIYRPRVTPHTTRAELFAIFEEATDHLNDVHVTVRDEREGRFARSGGRSLGTGEFDDGTFALELIQGTYLDRPIAIGGGGTMRWGRLGDLGYLRVEAFKYPTSSAASIDDLLADLADARALIIDIRHNGGGSDSIARNLAAGFADAERHVMTASGRCESADCAPPEEWHVGPSVAGPFDKPVVVLVNDRTISAAENFAIMMREFPHVVVVGQTTAGALADTYIHRVSDGWAFGVPSNILRDARGRSWEGIGVVPDIWAASSPDQISRGQDYALEVAMAIARESSR